MANAATPPRHLLFSRVRLATISDVPHIHKLIHQMAAFYHLSDHCSATEPELAAALFPSPPPQKPFSSVSAFIAEVSDAPFAPIPTGSPNFPPILKTSHLDLPIDDPDRESFRSSSTSGDVVVAGFVIFFPNYSTFTTRHGICLEDLYVREPYRNHKVGRTLFSAVAAVAARMGFGRVDFTVIHWNAKAIRFYERMGAQVLPDWRICRLTGEALQALGNLESHKL